MPDFSGARVLVVGDLMLDRYWSGATRRISPEAPVPVVNVSERHARAGGAGNVALNVLALGAQATVIGIVGDDDDGAQLRGLLQAAGADTRLAVDPDHPTIVKLRILSHHQQLIRLDAEQTFDGAAIGAFGEAFERSLGEADVVVLSDYAKGSLSGVQALIAAARQAGKPVLVDPKGRDFTRYSGATLITPNRSEFETVAGATGDDQTLSRAARVLLQQLQLEALLVTRGEQGMSLLQASGGVHHLRAEAREVFDVTGAGDTVIAVTAAALAAGASLEDAATLANVAAGIVVGKLGAATASPQELQAALHGPDQGGAVLTEDTLLQRVAAARAQGERVVMTNGCFDLLHAGHVDYLQQARRLGERLIVAVNDDDSVRRLKGERRPLTPLAQRMRVLAALECVDWVVPFGEDTPERLICAVLPDLLVKGGDYAPDDIAGAHCVRHHGGEVSVLPLTPGCSTSALIRAMGEDGVEA